MVQSLDIDCSNGGGAAHLVAPDVLGCASAGGGGTARAAGGGGGGMTRPAGGGAAAFFGGAGAAFCRTQKGHCADNLFSVAAQLAHGICIADGDACLGVHIGLIAMSTLSAQTVERYQQRMPF